MEIILKPKGKGLTNFLKFLGKKKFLTNSVNSITESDVCKMLFISAICNKTELFLTDGNKTVELNCNSIETSINDNEVLFTGFVRYKYGHSSRHVIVSGLVKF